MTTPIGSWAATIVQFQQAATAKSRAMGEPTAARYNPRPAGVVRRGSATHQVLQVLADRRGQWLTRERLVWHSGCTRKAIDWALIYLRARRVIDVTTELIGGHQRFRLTEGADVSIQVSSAPGPGDVEQRRERHKGAGADSVGSEPQAGHQSS